ncbi:hypothetical protein [Modestobacter roseus]|uniref:hypothetical protein n=1 Tax=Modestobacter roseus TaxID=1181884 RepID=UPI0034DF6571
MTSGLWPRWALAAALLAVAPVCAGCAETEPAPQTSLAQSPAPSLPTDARELEELLVDEVPSGLPRVPDDDLDPPAGEKTVDDVAGYGEDAQQQEEVLGEYGYLRGWERFWRDGPRITSVFIDQFADPAGAATYAEDLARNDAEYYGGTLDHAPAGLPEDCVLMAMPEAVPEHGLEGPPAFAWCTRGAFTVAVASVQPTAEEARTELSAVVAEQLAQLPDN